MAWKKGEKHHRAELSDAEVELMRELHDEGLWSIAGLAEKFDVAKSTAQSIVSYRTRRVA